MLPEPGWLIWIAYVKIRWIQDFLLAAQRRVSRTITVMRWAPITSTSASAAMARSAGSALAFHSSPRTRTQPVGAACARGFIAAPQQRVKRQIFQDPRAETGGAKPGRQKFPAPQGEPGRGREQPAGNLKQQVALPGGHGSVKCWRIGGL